MRTYFRQSKISRRVVLSCFEVQKKKGKIMIKTKVSGESKVYFFIELTNYYKQVNSGHVSLPSHIEAINTIRNFLYD